MTNIYLHSLAVLLAVGAFALSRLRGRARDEVHGLRLGIAAQGCLTVSMLINVTEPSPLPFLWWGSVLLLVFFAVYLGVLLATLDEVQRRAPRPRFVVHVVGGHAPPTPAGHPLI